MEAEARAIAESSRTVQGRELIDAFVKKRKPELGLPKTPRKDRA